MSVKIYIVIVNIFAKVKGDITGTHVNIQLVLEDLTIAYLFDTAKVNLL